MTKSLRVVPREQVTGYLEQKTVGHPILHSRTLKYPRYSLLGLAITGGVILEDIYYVKRRKILTI